MSNILTYGLGAGGLGSTTNYIEEIVATIETSPEFSISFPGLDLTTSLVEDYTKVVVDSQGDLKVILEGDTMVAVIGPFKDPNEDYRAYSDAYSNAYG